MGGNNILNRGAMEVLAVLGQQVPVLATRFEAVEKEVAKVPGIAETVIRLEVAMTHLTKAVEDEPLRCPMREVAARLPYVEKENEKQEELIRANTAAITDMETEVAKAEATSRKWGGVSTAIAAAIAAAGTAIANAVKTGNP